MNAKDKNEAQANVPKPKPKGYAGLTNAALRKLLLAKPTISDARWAPQRNVPTRNEGEDRATYINRVLRP